MDHNIFAYWRRMEGLKEGDPERPSPRALRLLRVAFERWQTKPAWLDWNGLGHLLDGPDGPELAKLSVAERKGLAIRRTLERLGEPKTIRRAGTMAVHPDELILGTLPPYSVGQGKELMRYLTEAETLDSALGFLNEWSPFGHIVPNYERLLRDGLRAMIDEARGLDSPFGRSVVEALEGVVGYAHRYAELAEAAAERYGDKPGVREDMLGAAARLRRVPEFPAETFLEALQSLYIVHCALHWTGDVTSLGRLDQVFLPYYEADLAAGRITPQEAQEAIDCLWIKLDEKVVLYRQHVEDRFTSSDGALLGSGGASNFDQGALVNQWMQQVTLGGVVADNEPEARDASNALTYMCLAASRRMPLNSPTLDLRVHKGTPPELLEAAARTQMSGGAHPVLLNDDRLIPALHERTGGQVELKSARNYACDGCCETLFPGETEFSFGFVPALDVLEKALNGGAGIGASGPVYLRGMKGSWRSDPAAEIESMEALWSILADHVLLGCHRFLRGILRAYGCKESVSPSPLLSALIDGCLETGRDLAGGGARYHVFAPLMTGISSAADALCAIETVVFNEGKASLAEIVACLRANWGDSPENFAATPDAARIAELRRLCDGCPKFGTGDERVDRIAWRLIETFRDSLEAARVDPVHEADWKNLGARYDRQGRPFEILFTPGVGTFEQYVFGGFFAGAGADGRKSGTPIASDMSPAPLHRDREPMTVAEDGTVGHVYERPILDALASYADPIVDALSDGAPADLNVREDFPLEALVEALSTFARGQGGNVLTITAANPDTLWNAAKDPEGHNLVRVRMGGWTEFFSALSNEHREQHRRRPLHTPGRSRP